MSTYPNPSYSLGENNKRNQDLIHFINKGNEYFSYAYEENTTQTSVATTGVAVPINNPNVPVIEHQIGTNFTSQITSGYPEFIHNAPTGLYECTFSVAMTPSTQGVNELDLEIHENGLMVAGYKTHLRSTGYTLASAQLFLQFVSGSNYSIWLNNQSNVGDIEVENFRLTARPLPLPFT